MIKVNLLVERGSIVITDEFKSYKRLIYNGYIHRVVEHNKGEYKRGVVHINGIENFWNWVKEKKVKFHRTFRKNLLLYLKEFLFLYLTKLKFIRGCRRWR